MQLRQKVLLILLIWILVVHVKTEKQLDIDLEKLIVKLPNGKLRGKDNGFYYSFESIPYAKPPVGALRFEAPQPYTQKWEGTFDASKKPTVCMQWDQYTAGNNKLIGVEDCLTINIYKPKIATDDMKKKNIPVVVLIHGGAFMFGSVDGSSHVNLMQNGNLMMVKMSYRLGPLGFLSTEDTVIPGNFGLKDQLLALQWIKQNIVHFGGDPERIMVLGFSSGGAAVHLQMMNKNFAKLARVAVSFSGTALNPWVVLRNSRDRAFQLAKNLNCSSNMHDEKSAAIKKCLKEKPASEIVAGVRDFLIFGYNPFTTFGPVVESANVEDAFLTKTPEDIIRSGQSAQIPWLASYSAQDGGYNAAELLKYSPTHGEELIVILNEHWDDLAPHTLFFKDTIPDMDLKNYSSTLRSQYLGDKEFSVHTYHDVQRMYTDVLFKNGIERAVRLHAAHAQSSTYAYVYDNPADEGIGTNLAERNDIKFGTVHGDDFFLMFHNNVRNKDLRADEKVISQRFITMLEGFIQNNNELTFGPNCTFVDNAGKDQLQLMFITQDACENKNVIGFP